MVIVSLVVDAGANTRRVAVVMTCHNRRDTTIRCLKALLSQKPGANVALFVTDDGSTDGTPDAIKSVMPNASVLSGTGHLYWAAGMALAEGAAVADRPDYLLWLNDDTVLKPDALKGLLALSDQAPGAIIVGACEDPETGSPTYGGRIRIDFHPQRLRRLGVSTKPQRADTFHGNVVLIPMAVRRRVGPIDGAFPHAYADDDYGLRATALGIPILQAPGVAASCRIEDATWPMSDTLRTRWNWLGSPKGLPWRAQVRYLRRHGDWRWPLLLVAGQAKRLTGLGR